jgi:hypothetical protein
MEVTNETQEIVGGTHGRISLRRYPLTAITGIDTVENDGTLTPDGQANYVWEASTGLLFGLRTTTARKTLITYTAGYQVLPADLEMALWQVFDTVWASMQPGGGGSSVSGGQAIKSVTLADVGTIHFDVGSSGNAQSSSAGWGFIPVLAQSILDRYRRGSTVGVG